MGLKDFEAAIETLGAKSAIPDVRALFDANMILFLI